MELTIIIRMVREPWRVLLKLMVHIILHMTEKELAQLVNSIFGRAMDFFPKAIMSSVQMVRCSTV